MDLEEQTSDLYRAIQNVVHVDWLSTALTVFVALTITAVLSHAVAKILRCGRSA